MNQQSRMILALVLSMGVVLGYQTFFAPPPSAPVEETSKEALASGSTQAGSSTGAPDTKAPAQAASGTGLANVLSNDLARHELSNETVALSLSNSELGLVEHVRLIEKRFLDTDANGEAIGHDVLELEGRSSLGLGLDAAQSTFALPTGHAAVVESSDNAFAVRRSNDLVDVTQRVELAGGYEARYTISVTNKSSGAQSFAWRHELRMGVNTGADTRNAVFRAICGSNDSDDDVDWSDVDDDGRTRLEVERPRFAGLDTKYFLGALVGSKAFISCTASPNRDPAGIGLSVQDARVTIASGETKSETYGLYFGPKSTQWLDSPKVIPDVSLSPTVDWGWFGGLSKALGSVMLRLLRWFHSIAGNWGLAIVMLTVVVKLLTLPLSLKQYKSMAAMRELAPELKELQEKYGDDPMKLNQERQSLMTRKGVNPLAGCLPLIVQFPIWIALYAMLGAAVELYHEQFLWLPDLTKPDPLHILPFLLGGLSWFQMHIQPNTAGDPQQQAVMKWMMPMIFLVMMWFLPSGLGIYMFANITLTLIQSYFQLGPARREAKMAASK